MTPDVNQSQDKYGIRLEVPGADGMSEMWIRCDTVSRHVLSVSLDSPMNRGIGTQESQYAKWMAACRLAAKGKTMADASYDAEVKSILAFLAMQKPSREPAIDPSSYEINPEDYVAPRFVRKLKNKVLLFGVPLSRDPLIVRRVSLKLSPFPNMPLSNAPNRLSCFRFSLSRSRL